MDDRSLTPKSFQAVPGAIPKAPRSPRIDYPPEERTPPRSSGDPVALSASANGVTISKGRIHIGTAALVAAVVAVASAFGGRATADAPATDMADIKAEIRDLKREVRAVETRLTERIDRAVDARR